MFLDTLRRIQCTDTGDYYLYCFCCKRSGIPTIKFDNEIDIEAPGNENGSNSSKVNEGPCLHAEDRRNIIAVYGLPDFVNSLASPGLITGRNDKNTSIIQGITNLRHL